VIVVGIDGSASSRDAARWAMQQARLTHATVRAVSSWRWPNYLTRIPPGVDLADETAAVLGEVIDGVLAEDPAFGGVDDAVHVTKHVLEGPPGPALLTQAEDAILLVVGARGRAAFPGMLLGSVAEYCVRNGPCPVVVVRVGAEGELSPVADRPAAAGSAEPGSAAESA
jgi:nucleotide-binding universal stress UspA family protein